MLPILAPQTPEAESASGVSTTFSQQPPAPSALSAAISMGRFLAYNPQFAQVDALHWQPRSSGEVRVDVAMDRPDAARLIAALRMALGFRAPESSRYESPRTHLPMVSLVLRGRYENAQWSVEALVTAEAYAASMALDLVSAA